MSQNVITLEDKLEMLIDFDGWSPTGGGYPCDEEENIDEFFENFGYGDEKDEALKEWCDEMCKDKIKAILPVYEAHTEKFEKILGYPYNEKFTQQLRKLSSKPKI